MFDLDDYGLDDVGCSGISFDVGNYADNSFGDYDPEEDFASAVDDVSYSLNKNNEIFDDELNNV